jgi:hypothetical protein
MPYNMGDFKIVGADPSDTQRELEDGGDFYIYGAKVYVTLVELSRGLKREVAAKVDEKGYYETYLESYKYKAYTWEEIQPIAIDLLFKWYENGKQLRPEKHYKVKT